MASFTITTSTFTEQALVTGEIGTVAANGLIAADTAIGVTVTGSLGSGVVTLNVLGQILSNFRDAVNVQNTNLRLLVGSDGVLTSGTVSGVSYSAVVIQGANSLNEIDNMGLIQSQSSGIYFEGLTGFSANSDLELFNSGTILG